MCTKSTMLAVAALLVCAACGQQPARTKLADSDNLQTSDIRWIEATAATYSARVNNNGLIMMR